MRVSRLTAALSVAAVLLSACGGSAATQAPAGATQATGGGGGGTATEAPQGTEAPPATDAGGGGGGGGGSGDDVEAVARQLVPPNSTEIQKTTATDTWFVIYESTDSVDSLKAFYQDAIGKAGQKIFSTTTIQGGVSYVFAKDENGGLGGSVNIFPSGDGKTSVQLTVAKT